jgi:hypothetical protein
LDVCFVTVIVMWMQCFSATKLLKLRQGLRWNKCAKHLTHSRMRCSSTFPWFEYLPVPLNHLEVNAQKKVEPEKADKVKPPVIICHGMLGMAQNWMAIARVISVSSSVF